MDNLETSKLKKNIGEKIKFYRKKRGLSQDKLAEIVDIEMKSLSRIESGHNYPQCENLIAIAKALKVAPWQLYFFENEISIEDMKKEIIATLNEESKIIPSIYQYVVMQSVKR